MLAEAEDFKRELAQQSASKGALYQGLETEKIFAALIVAGLSDEPMQATEIGAMLEERDRRVFFEILFEEAHEGDLGRGRELPGGLRTAADRAGTGASAAGDREQSGGAGHARVAGAEAGID